MRHFTAKLLYFKSALITETVMTVTSTITNYSKITTDVFILFICGK